MVGPNFAEQDGKVIIEGWGNAAVYAVALHRSRLGTSGRLDHGRLGNRTTQAGLEFAIENRDGLSVQAVKEHLRRWPVVVVTRDETLGLKDSPKKDTAERYAAAGLKYKFGSNSEHGSGELLAASDGSGADQMWQTDFTYFTIIE